MIVNKTNVLLKMLLRNGFTRSNIFPLKFYNAIV
jgi:hypothetical protein